MSGMTMPPDRMILAASSTDIDRNVTFAARHEADEARRRHDAGRHEDRQQVAFAAGLRVCDLACRLSRHEHERPQAFRRELDQPDLLEILVRPGRRDHAFEDLFDGAVDIAHDRRARHHQFARRDERPAQAGWRPARRSASGRRTRRAARGPAPETADKCRDCSGSAAAA